ncbi:MAG: NADH-quinone oxidoreductase subunit J [Acidobacteriota bacterium]
MQPLAFYLLAAIILGGAVMMVSSRNLVHSVIWMVASFIGIAGLFILLEAEFVAAVQILVYAGGIVVLFLFVIMLVNLGDIQQMEYLHHQWLPAMLLALLLVGELGFLLWAGGQQLPTNRLPAESVLRGLGGNTQTLGMMLYTDYLLPFEVASVLLLVAMIGAIYLAKKKV